MAGSVVCFGELLIRLSGPGHERLLQTPSLDVAIGGAEANVAVCLARFGHQARMASVVADNELGQAAIAEISAHKLVSVDLEFHLEHSFLGFACLIQISVEGCDYVIDPLPLFEKLWILNFIFANPAITKIFHGSDADIMMLQKDFGVYLVNLVDTYRLALITNNASCALGSLLQSPNQRLL